MAATRSTPSPSEPEYENLAVNMSADTSTIEERESTLPSSRSHSDEGYVPNDIEIYVIEARLTHLKQRSQYLMDMTPQEVAIYLTPRHRIEYEAWYRGMMNAIRSMDEQVRCKQVPEFYHHEDDYYKQTEQIENLLVQYYLNRIGGYNA